MTKTIFCDIDGTILRHYGKIQYNLHNNAELLPGVLEKINQWEKMNYKIILTTGRKESTRQNTETQLFNLGVFYDELIMGLPNGERILINDKKPDSKINTAYSINLVRNNGMKNLEFFENLPTEQITQTNIDKPWGWEQIIEHNDKYVVKKLFMKKDHSCSLQYHQFKTETITVLSGKLKILIGENKDDLTEKIYNFGETITILPYTIHRMTAIEDTLYIESSTNELWDVIRLNDDYGRI